MGGLGPQSGAPFRDRRNPEYSRRALDHCLWHLWMAWLCLRIRTFGPAACADGNLAAPRAGRGLVALGWPAGVDPWHHHDGHAVERDPYPADVADCRCHSGSCREAHATAQQAAQRDARNGPYGQARPAAQGQAHRNVGASAAQLVFIIVAKLFQEMKKSPQCLGTVVL